MTEPLVFTHGAAMTAFNVTTGAWFAFELIMNVRQRLRAGREAAHDPSWWVVYISIAAAVGAAQFFGRFGHQLWPGGLLWPVIVGLILIVAGVGLRAWSIFTLGRFFQYQIRIQAGHKVVTNGPYRFVRHPSYTGVILAVLGYALATDDIYSVLAAAVLAGIGLTVRIRVEERQLRQALGADYDDFAAHRKRLIPGVF